MNKDLGINNFFFGRDGIQLLTKTWSFKKMLTVTTNINIHQSTTTQKGIQAVLFEQSL